MGLRQLSDLDFAYWTEYARKDRDVHEKEFLEVLDPDLMRAIYRGMRFKDTDLKLFQEKAQKKRENLVTLTKIFTATNTVLPNLYYQNPRKLAIPRQETRPEAAALMTAVLRHYAKLTRQKEENQEAVMNAWFMGVGWKKIGYHVATESDVKEPESKLSFTERAALGIKSALGIDPELTQHRDVPEIVHYEKLVNTAEDPASVILDHKGTWRDYKVITHRMKRSLHDLLEFSNYDRATLKRIRDKKERQHGTRFDLRDIELNLNEMMIKQRNGTWLLAWVDEHHEPLRYDRINHEGSFPWVPLVLTNEPNVRYPTSHLSVASKAQEWIDNVANLQVEILGKVRNQMYINQNILAHGQEHAFKKNLIGGIIFGKRTATPGDITPIASKGIDADMFNVRNLFQQNLQEIVGADPQRISGSSRNKTLGQDKLAAVGTQIRESGMRDRIRQWVIDQAYIEGQFVKQYSNATLHLELEPKDFAAPQAQEIAQVLPKQDMIANFMTIDHPLPIRQFLEGEFDYDVNVFEAIKPDNQTRKAELMEVLSVAAQLQPAMIQQGSRFNLAALGEKLAETFETVNASEFIEKLDSRQQAALQAMQTLQNAGGNVPPAVSGPAQAMAAQEQEAQEASSGE